MNDIRETPGAVFAGGSVLLMGRVTRADGQLITPADIASASYRIEARDPCCPSGGTRVEGHDGVAVTPEEVLYATPQTGPPWDIDATGYNFRHEIDIGSNPAFPAAGRFYTVRYELIPVSGQPIVIRYLIEAI